MQKKYLKTFEQQSERLPKNSSFKSPNSANSNSYHVFADPAQESMSVPKKNDDHFALEYETKQKLYFHEGFTATIDQFLRKIVQDKRVQWISSHYPLLKMLKAVLKKFLMTELEVVLYYYFLEKSNWHYASLMRSAKEFPDLLNFTDVKNLQEYKAIFCYLTLSAFYVKCLLNDEQEVLVYQNHFLSIYPNFNIDFLKWVHNDEPILVIDLIHLHKISKEMIENLIHSKNGEKYLDYNSMVDDILEICPHYNYSESKNKSEMKKIKKNPIDPTFEKNLVGKAHSGPSISITNTNINTSTNKNNGENLSYMNFNQPLPKLMTRSMSKNKNEEAINKSTYEASKIFEPSISYNKEFNWLARSTLYVPDFFNSFRDIPFKNDELNVGEEFETHKLQEEMDNDEEKPFNISFSEKLTSYFKKKK